MKRKESHWKHEEEIIPNKRKTRKEKKKNCTALQIYKSSECSIPLRYTVIIVMMITTSFAGNSTIKNT